MRSRLRSIAAPVQVPLTSRASYRNLSAYFLTPHTSSSTSKSFKKEKRLLFRSRFCGDEGTWACAPAYAAQLLRFKSPSPAELPVGTSLRIFSHYTLPRLRASCLKKKSDFFSEVAFVEMRGLEPTPSCRELPVPSLRAPPDAVAAIRGGFSSLARRILR